MKIQNQVDDNKQTPLFYAAKEGNVEAVAYLIGKGADATRTDRNKQTALYYAVKTEDPVYVFFFT